MTVITRIDPSTEDVKRLLKDGFQIAAILTVDLSFVWSQAQKGTEYVFVLREEER